VAGLLLGVISFFLVFWADVVSLKGTSILKPVLWAAGTVLFLAGLVLIVREPPRIGVPGAVQIVGWVLAVLSALLLAYSLFLEIPFVSAYLRKGGPSRLVTSGTYALCRHPGVLWLAALLVGAFLGSGSRWVLAALPVWFGLDVLYVVLQEKLFFVKLFGADYREYQGRVPMVIPTSRSARECARTLFKRRPR
jgi:protein-S-isoprenylcysteine O-methyltransferase Ste14